MNKIVSDEEWVEARKALLKKGILYVKVAVVAVLTVMIYTAAPSALNLQQRSIAQEQQQPQQQQTTYDPGKPIEDLSFEIDNVTFSHHTASVNGIQMHYVIGGQGDPVVLLHGWPQTWYEWRHVMPALAKYYTVVAPDLRGFGVSSKPVTGYDGNTTAEDIYQLVAQLEL
ncbi:MAG: alpha/beta fold hydrolase, partial [Nitrososphaeraceae archaeon]